MILPAIRYMLLLSLVCLLLGGCSRSSDGLPPLYPCQITILQEGKPLSNAYVTLFIDRGESTSETGHQQNWAVSGATDSEGIALIGTNGRRLGAPQATYKVTIVKTVAAASKLGPPPPEDTPAYRAWSEKSVSEVVPIYSVVDQKYSKVDQTPEIITIKKGKNNFSIDVGAPVNIRMP